MADKIESLLGFAVRAGKVIYGIDNIETVHKKRYLIVMCGSVSERSEKRCVTYAKQSGLPLIKVKNKLLEDIIFKTKCKVVAISDKQMSVAMLKYVNDNYEVLTSEVN